MIPADDFDAAEARIQAAAAKALAILAGLCRERLAAADWSTDVLDNRWPEWRQAVTDLQATIEGVYVDGWNYAPIPAPVTSAATDPFNLDPAEHAQTYIEATTDRLVRVADGVFDSIRDTLADGIAQGQALPEVAKMIDKDLANHNTEAWDNRAITIARTESVAAMNGGGWDAASATAGVLGHAETDVAKQWLATNDARTRPTHAAKDGDVVLGLRAPFTVGDSLMQYPGDPDGTAAEIVNCRCSLTYLYPGDLGYPTWLAASGATISETQEDTMTATAEPVRMALDVEPDDVLDVVDDHPDCDGWAVVDEDGDLEGCFDTEDEARQAIEDAQGTSDDEDAAAAVLTWHGVLLVEGIPTGDGRKFAQGSVNWPDTAEYTVPLKWQEEEAYGHDGSIVVGSIDVIARDGDQITATGRWHDSPEAQAARELVRGGFARGVSVDVDAAEVRFVDEDGEEVDWEEAMWSDDPLILEIIEGRLRAATLCAIPAFVEAQIFDDAGDAEVADEQAAADRTVLTAAAVAAMPPSAWFTDPNLDGPTPLTIDGDHLFGHLATWGTCHVAYDGVCVTPPESVTNYGYFATGQVVCEDGTRARVGQITMGTGHAPAVLGMRAAAEHYDNTGSAVADVAVGEDEHGIWLNGCFRTGTTPEQRAQLLAAGCLSGDWRDNGGHLELMAALAVNVPGFPIPVPAVAASGGRQTSLVAAGHVSRPETHGMTPAQVARAVHSYVRRERRVEKARARMRARRLAAVTAKING